MAKQPEPTQSAGRRYETGETAFEIPQTPEGNLIIRKRDGSSSTVVMQDVLNMVAGYLWNMQQSRPPKDWREFLEKLR